jgi:hypothetical protein
VGTVLCLAAFFTMLFEGLFLIVAIEILGFILSAIGNDIRVRASFADA